MAPTVVRMHSRREIMVLSENTPELRQSSSGREKGRNTSHIKNVESSEPTQMSVCGGGLGRE